jgi:hypothetical protein
MILADSSKPIYLEQERLHIGATIDTVYRLLPEFIDGADVYVCQTKPLVAPSCRFNFLYPGELYSNRRAESLGCEDTV